MRVESSLFASLVLFLSGAAWGQGDSCATPTYYIYIGGHMFDTTGLTQSGFEVGQACDLGPQNAFWADGFAIWFVTNAGNYQFDTNTTGWDTQLAIYDGNDCNAVCLGRDDNSGAGQSSLIRLPGLEGGQQVLIQIGGASGAEGPGLLTITPYGPDCAPGSEDAFENNDDCANAYPLESGTYPGLFASRSDRDFYSLCIPPGETAQLGVEFVHAFGDLNAVLWDAASMQCGSTPQGSNFLAKADSDNDNELFSWTNNSGSSMQVVLEINLASSSVSDCNSYGLVLSGVECLTGAAFCPAAPNSTGLPARLTGIVAPGSGSGVGLRVDQGPPGQSAYFLVGDTDASPGLSVGAGQLCLVGVPGARVFRYNLAGGPFQSIGAFDGQGVLQNLVGTALNGEGFDVPAMVPGGGPILAGSTWYFQCWYRDTASGSGSSNLSNGLSVAF